MTREAVLSPLIMTPRSALVSTDVLRVTKREDQQQSLRRRQPSRDIFRPSRVGVGPRNVEA